MAKDIKQTRREKVVVRLLEEGGEARLDTLHDWSALKLLCTHQAFSELMEGMVEDGLVRWDGTSFSLHSEGRALARKVLESAGKDPDAIEASAGAAGGEDDHDHGHDHGGGHDHGHSHAHEPEPDEHDHGHSHDHGGGHDHSHGHGAAAAGVPGGKADKRDARYGTGEEMDLPPPTTGPRRPPPPPVQPPPRSGLRASVKGALKKLLGR